MDSGQRQKLSDTTFLANGRMVSILASKKEHKGTILCLPGWSYSRLDVCEKSAFCEKALAQGYHLVLPEMEKSIYASQPYPETRKDWLGFPQLPFITDTLIPHLQRELGLLLYGQNNFLYGISTGGRGVALIAVHTDTLFRAGAALSGDFNQLLDSSDNLMKGWYGEYKKFPERWKTDNPSMTPGKIMIPLFFAHGMADKVVPDKQTTAFEKLLRQTKASTTPDHVAIIKPDAGHDYEFWDSQTQAVLKFFDANCR
ncbi:MAG: prolyl oligopeptidase family serine peptidase [Bacteroidota bacterium]